jgi:hypothetical protein
LRSSLSLLQPNASPWTQGYTYDSVMRLSTVTSLAGGTLKSPTGIFTCVYSGGGDRVLGLQLPAFPTGSNLFITNRYDSLARLTKTYLRFRAGVTFPPKPVSRPSFGIRSRKPATASSASGRINLVSTSPGPRVFPLRWKPAPTWPGGPGFCFKP